MFFKNAIVFQSDKPLSGLLQNIAEALDGMPCNPPGAQEMTSEGFVPLVANEGVLAANQNGYIFCAYQEITRLLPAAVVNEELLERVTVIEEEQNRKVGRKERAELKEQILFELLPQAFTRSSRTYVVLDTNKDRVYVGESSEGKAEKAINALRKALGTLPVKPIARQAMGADAVFATWIKKPELANQQGFHLGDACELAQSGQGAKFKGLEITSKNVHDYLSEGLSIKRINLLSEDDVEFDVTADMHLKGIKLGDRWEGAIDEELETELESRMAQLKLSGVVVSGLVDRLLDAMPS